MARTKGKVRKATRKAAARARDLGGKMQRAARAKIRKTGRSGTLRRAGEAALLAGAAAVAGAAADEAVRALRRPARTKLNRPALGSEIRIPEQLDQAILRVTEALKEEGFGILTRIDVQATLKEKLGVEFRPYTILGACNPPLAHRALTTEPEVGLLLPCNVTVEQDGLSGSLVRITDPAAMLGFGHLAENPTLREVAADAGERLARVRDALAPHTSRVVF